MIENTASLRKKKGDIHDVPPPLHSCAVLKILNRP
jgi:hypothetical protein